MHTLEIRAIEVTDNSVGDAPMLLELLEQIPPDEPIASVSGDGAYDTKACHAAIAQRNAQAVIPRARTPRRGRRPWWERMRATKRCEPVTDWGAASGKVEQLSPQKSGGDQDALLQTPGPTGDGAHV